MKNPIAALLGIALAFAPGINAGYCCTRYLSGGGVDCIAYPGFTGACAGSVMALNWITATVVATSPFTSLKGILVQQSATEAAA
ncbi:hypothetical protein FGADI_4309 [Fusarium gaditjirri]|uniref:Uncharacterized protein n=1 Tax=Fusarium gaditjirri TaxID=282569 RepID=A0A8H4TD39_9HYPO|nr:hypothetical protein FGADI_4309 [Fusarium gaditjirri]